MFETMREGARILGTVLALALAATVVVAEAPRSATETLVEAYVPMQEALAADSAKTLKEQAAKLATAAAAAAEAAEGDKAAFEAVAAAAKGMTATEIGALRGQFKALSAALAKLIERQAVDGLGIYFCPMADAYWVQKQGDVANPYYGKQMLRCGEAVEKVEG